MKLVFLSLVLLLFSFVSLAQGKPADTPAGTVQEESNNQALQKAGAALRKHHKQYYLGSGIMIGGLVVITASGLTVSDSPGLLTFGILTALTGTVLQVISHRHIGRAGQILEEASFSSFHLQPASSGTGLALAYRF